MRIEFVNHSSVIFRHKEISLMCDPWIEGPVFHNGWNLIAPTKFNFSDFEKITHIWFSHEHPDHFFPPNIKKINEEFRKKITVFYQKSKDQKVIKFLKSLNFKEVIELDPDLWFELDVDLNIKCNTFGHDSWLCLKTQNITILNTNDCVIRDIVPAVKILERTGKIDILLTQFSYGQYEGNKDEPLKREMAVKTKFGQMDTQIEVFKPTFLIPMASFVYFCHEENFYMNDRVNRIGHVYDYYKQKKTTLPIVMYCGEVWDIENGHPSSLDSIKKWDAHYDNLNVDPKLIKATSVSLNDLTDIAANRVKTFKKNSKTKKHLLELAKLTIYLSDLEVLVTLSSDGLKRISNSNYKIEMSSEVLFYCLKFDWGFNTTHVNGRVQFYEDGLKEFIRWEILFNNLNHKHEYPPTIFERIVNKVKRSIKIMPVIDEQII